MKPNSAYCNTCNERDQCLIGRVRKNGRYVEVWRYESKTQIEAKQLLQVIFYFFSFRLFRYTLDECDVPSWAIVESATTGFTSWKSPFQKWIGKSTSIKEYRANV